MSFRVHGDGARAGLLVAKESNADFMDLVVSFDRGPSTRTMLAAKNEWFVEPPGAPIPAEHDVGEWTLTFRDARHRAWLRSSNDIGGPALHVEQRP